MQQFPASPSDTKLAQCAIVLAKYRKARESKSVDFISRNRRLLAGWKALKKEHQLWIQQQQKLNRSEGHLFNPLHLMSIGETKHSLLLGYLLQPRESHSYGKAFLIPFLTMLGVADPELGEWEVTVERYRIDLLLRRKDPASVVIIENKSNNAVDAPNQLYRYWRKVIHDPHQIEFNKYQSADIQSHFKIIYLSSGAYKSPELHSLLKPASSDDSEGLPDRLPLNYEHFTFNEDIAGWLADMVKLVEDDNLRLRTYLEFYKEPESVSSL